MTGQKSIIVENIRPVAFPLAVLLAGVLEPTNTAPDMLHFMPET
jgi:hypothetical protein